MRRRSNPNGALTRVLGPPAARQRGEGGRNPVAEETAKASQTPGPPRTRRTLQHGRSERSEGESAPAHKDSRATTSRMVGPPRRRSRGSRRTSRENSLWSKYLYTRVRAEDEPKEAQKPKESQQPQNHTTQWPRVFVPEGQRRGRGGPPDRGRRGQRVLRVSGCPEGFLA